MIFHAYYDQMCSLFHNLSIIFDGNACMFQSLGISELLSTSSTGVVFQVGIR